MSLKKYNTRRDFQKTREPKGAKKKTRARRSYVLQKHDASRLHYDFRLELDGVLKSWAIPKGPSINPKHRRLAVMTEDHPPEYRSFEGVIPEDEYGGGVVMLWDRGTWKPLDAHPAEALRAGKLSFTLNGKRLKGRWALVRMHSRKNADHHHGENWLLIKHDDQHADGRRNVLKQNTSVKTGRTMKQIARGEKPARKPDRTKAVKK